MSDSFEYDNEPWSSVKAREVFDQLSRDTALVKGFAPTKLKPYSK
jgi:hypothetical protein